MALGRTPECTVAQLYVPTVEPPGSSFKLHGNGHK